ncbi:MAG: DedA family protein [Actinomycetes bacterium]
MDSVILAAALTGQVTDWLNNFGPIIFYLIVWGLVFAGTGLFIGAFIPFITGDSLIFAAGVLAASSGSINIIVLSVGVGLAAFLGDQVGFVLGRHYGRPYLDKREGPRLRSAIVKSEKFYAELGWWAVVVARFMPWARVLVPAIAGIARMNYYKFLGANFVGAITWGVGLTLAGYYAVTIPAVKTGSYAIATFFIVGSIVAGIRSWWNNRKS